MGKKALHTTQSTSIHLTKVTRRWPSSPVITVYLTKVAMRWLLTSPCNNRPPHWGSNEVATCFTHTHTHSLSLSPSLSMERTKNPCTSPPLPPPPKVGNISPSNYKANSIVGSNSFLFFTLPICGHFWPGLMAGAGRVCVYIGWESCVEKYSWTLTWDSITRCIGIYILSRTWSAWLFCIICKACKWVMISLLQFFGNWQKLLKKIWPLLFLCYEIVVCWNINLHSFGYSFESDLPSSLQLCF
jgi:hypothetical protein